MLMKNKGFTLVELVVVIAILGILAALAIPRFMDANASARGTKIVADLRTIDSALVIYEVKGQPEGALKETPNATDNLKKLVKAGLLASVPTPPSGTALFPHGIKFDIGKNAYYAMVPSDKYVRAAFFEYTVDELLKTEISKK